MSKQKLAQMVLKKMKQKKQAQQLARPHYQVLQQQITFSLQHNQSLSYNIQALALKLNNQSTHLIELKANLSQLQNTGKQSFPIIIIKPEFIASQNINSQIKEFYRKASNTFYKNDIVKLQKYSTYIERQEQIKNIVGLINQAQISKQELRLRNQKLRNQKRLNILKADLKRRKFIQTYQFLSTKISQSKAHNIILLSQYQLKKQNLQQRTNVLSNLIKSIEQIKDKITSKYNPTSYRQYLKKIFDIRIKNQYMESNLVKAISNLNLTKNKLLQHRKKLQDKCKLTFFGITHDSPSKQKGKMQKIMNNLKQIDESTNPKSISDLLNNPSNPQLNKTLPKKNSNLSQISQIPRLRRSLRKSSNDRNYSSLKTLKSTLRTEATNNHSGTKRYQSIY